MRRKVKLMLSRRKKDPKRDSIINVVSITQNSFSFECVLVKPFCLQFLQTHTGCSSKVHVLTVITITEQNFIFFFCVCSVSLRLPRATEGMMISPVGL